VNHPNVSSVNHKIICTTSVAIRASREDVWDYTQDYHKRMFWDLSVVETTIVQAFPNRIVTIRTSGSTTMTFVYKLDDRPNQTSLVATDIHSPFIESAAGSWKYEEHDGATIWTQTNSIVLKRSIFSLILVPLFRYVFDMKTRKAMLRAKELIEKHRA
jgi:hypothetical protein